MDTKKTIVNTKDEHIVFVACNARSNGSICICISIECHRLHTHKKNLQFRFRIMPEEMEGGPTGYILFNPILTTCLKVSRFIEKWGHTNKL